MTLYRMVRALWATWREANRGTRVRLLGVGVSGLEHRYGDVPTSGMAAGNQIDSPGEQQLDRVFDSINARYGDARIVHGLTLRRRRNEPGKS